MIVDRHDQLSERLVSGSLSEPVDRHMNSADAGFHGGETVCRHQSVIVVSMEIDPEIRRRRVDPVQIARHLFRRQNSERIRQHDPFDLHFRQSPQESEHIRKGVRHSVGPVFEIHIHLESHFPGLFDLTADIGKVFLRLFAQLDPAVVFGSFCQEIEDRAAAFPDPVCGFPAVDESENFHPVETVSMLGPLQNGPQSLLLPFRHAGRTDLQPVNMKMRNEKTRNLKLLCWSVRDAGGLLAVAQCGVKHLDIAGESVFHFHFCTCSFCIGLLFHPDRSGWERYNTIVFHFCKFFPEIPNKIRRTPPQRFFR